MSIGKILLPVIRYIFILNNKPSPAPFIDVVFHFDHSQPCWHRQEHHRALHACVLGPSPVRQRQFVTRKVYTLLNADSNRTFFSLCFNNYWQCNALQVQFRAWRALNSLLLTYLLTYLSPGDGRQRIGRPRQTWLRTIENDLDHWTLAWRR